MARLKNKGRCWLLFAGAGVSCYLHAIMPTLEPAKAELCGRSADAIQASDEISTAACWWCCSWCLIGIFRLILRSIRQHWPLIVQDQSFYYSEENLCFTLMGLWLLKVRDQAEKWVSSSMVESKQGLSRSKSRCCLLFAVNDGAASSWLLRWIKLHLHFCSNLRKKSANCILASRLQEWVLTTCWNL